MIGVVVAMESEAEILLSSMEIKEERKIAGKKTFSGKAFGKDVVVVLSGVGKVNAAIGTEILLLVFHVDALLNFGVAGSVNEATKLCSVYSIESAVQFDFDLTQLNGTKIGTLDEYTENYLPLTIAVGKWERRKLGTADRFNDSPADYELLTKTLGADIRDMEGAAIVQAAYKARIPVYSFKAISDVAGSGSTTEQYLKNRASALNNLKADLPDIFTLF